MPRFAAPVLLLLCAAACVSEPTVVVGTPASDEPRTVAPLGVAAAQPPTLAPPERAPLITTCPGKDTWADFRNPPRKYDRTAVAGFEVELELDAKGKRSPHVKQALASLEKGLRAIHGLVPEAAFARLQSTRIFVMRGGEPGVIGCPGGGHYRGALGRPMRDNDDPLWAHSVVFYSAKNLNDTTVSLPFMVHELAHAYHELLSERVNARIEGSYQNALGAGLYRNVKQASGKLDAQAYALTNHREYFADLSAIYFTKHWEYPYERAPLIRYDPVGAAMVQWAWDQAAPAEAPQAPTVPTGRIVHI
jgi:dipeptidyl-peptidase-4